MALEVTLKEIKQVEAEAEERERQASEQARDMIRQARQKAEALVQEAEIEARQQAVEIVHKAAEQADNELKPEWEANTRRCEEIRWKAQSRMSQAVDLILERIMGV